MQALSQALLDLPVGEVQAAVEGRQADPAGAQPDGRATSPAATIPISTANCSSQIARRGPKMRASMQALNRRAAGDDARRSTRRQRRDRPRRREYARPDLSQALDARRRSR